MSTFGQFVTPVAAWIVTYAIHSSLLLGAAALLTRLLLRSDARRETIWRGALLGSVVTATLVTLAPVEPALGRIGIGGDTGAVAASQAAAPTGSRSPAVGSLLAPGAPPAPASERAEGGDAAPGPGLIADVTPILIVGWAGTAAFLLALLLTRNLRLFRRLHGRQPLTDGRLPSVVTELRRNAAVWRPVTLSVSPACSGPMVIGASEICLPPRFVSDLDEEEQRAALAHEIAHIRRRDPLWQFGTGILSAALFFQPLNVIARRRLREAAEHLCDDWAVRQTGAPMALGRCLTAVASWVPAEPLPHLEGTLAMAEGGSPLLHRIRRLAEGVPESPALRLPAVVAVLALLAATVAAAPAASTAEPGSSEQLRHGADSNAGTTTDMLPAADALETIQLFERLAMQDSSARVREEAVDALSDLPHPAAAAALMRIVRRSADADVRAEAAQKLDEFPTDAVVTVLLEVVLEDSVAAVRSDALDVLDDFDLGSARAALRRLAREHPLPEIRRAAVEALTDGG